MLSVWSSSLQGKSQSGESKEAMDPQTADSLQLMAAKDLMCFLETWTASARAARASAVRGQKYDAWQQETIRVVEVSHLNPSI